MTQKKLIQMGATLFGVGMLTGIWSALALSETIRVPIPRLALAAHLNGILGGLWMILVGLTFPFLNYSEKKKQQLALGVSIPAWGNWLLTLIASFLGVRGINFNADPMNNALAVALQLFVVIPTLCVCVFWILGISEKSSKS